MFSSPHGNRHGAGVGTGVGPGVGAGAGAVVGAGHLPPASLHGHGGHFGAHPNYVTRLEFLLFRDEVHNRLIALILTIKCKCKCSK